MTNETIFKNSEKSRVKRGVKRASYDKARVYELVDDLKLGHLGFVSEGQAIIIPITLWRVGEHLYFHVANKSRLQKMLEKGDQVCIALAECTEWVMAKSAYHHSANYRSAVLYCRGDRVVDPEEFDRVFKSVINDIESDRWQQLRPPSPQERKGTALMKLSIEEGSFKSRTGGPNEDAEDRDLPVWNGTLPVCPVHRK